MKFQINTSRGLSKIILLIITMAFTQQAMALFSDTFTGGQHDPGWRFYDPYNSDGDNNNATSNEPDESTLIYEGGNALISIPSGAATHDLWAGSLNKAPRLLQPVEGNADFEIQAKFETEPKIKHQLQGIIIQQSDNVFLRFDIYYNENELGVLVAYVNGADGSFPHEPVNLSKGFPKYQKVKRTGMDWIFSYSEDGASWTDIPFKHEMTVTSVGVFAGTAKNTQGFLSSVDYFIDLGQDSASIDTDNWVPASVSSPKIDTWYAQPTINFGQAGISQKWANILGNVSSDIIIDTLTYEVNNNGLMQKLPLGSDGFDFRLENKGDFNIEIDHTTLEPGPNSVTIRAKDTQGQITTKTVTINYAPADIGLPSAYITDWKSLGNDIQKVEDIAHVVDGLWNLTADGIRTKEDGYDRAISIGDMNWLSNNYEVTVPFILHSDFTGIGFGVGWQGHEINNHQASRSPRVGWPLQSLVWIRGEMGRSTLEILTYKGENSLPKEWELQVGMKKPLTPLILNQKYWLKSYSKPLSNSMSRFYAKFWKDGDGEPDSWMINADVSTRDGSILLVTYEADVTFGNVSVNERRTDPSEDTTPDTTPPVISEINVVKNGTIATISWKTDEPSNSVINYGVNSVNEFNVNDSSLSKIHSLALTGLRSNVDYYFKIKSADSRNNTASSEEQTFFISASTYELPHNEWHLISLPMNPGVKNKVSDIFGEDDLGKYGTSWAVFHYDASNKDYVDLGLNGEMEQGMGYWIIQMSSTTKTLGMPAGSLSTQVDVSGKFEIPLVTKDGRSQFNMIGYPFNAKGHFKDARIETNETECDSDSGCTKNIADAKENNILHNELWTYSGGSGYIKINTTNGSLVPWQGYWAETLSGADGKEPSLLFSKPENSNN